MLRAIRVFLGLFCGVSTVVFAGAADAQGDADRRRQVLPFVRDATDCISRAAREDREFTRAVLAGNLPPLLARAKSRCIDQLAAMSIAHDRIYGPGSGGAFMRGPYEADLERAVRTRLKAEIDQISSQLQQAQGERARDEFFDCAFAAAERMLRSNEPAESIARGAMSVCHAKLGAAIEALSGALGGGRVSAEDERYLEERVRDRLIAAIIARRSDLAASAPATAPATRAPAPAVPGAPRQAAPPATRPDGALSQEELTARYPNSGPALPPLQQCLAGAMRAGMDGRMVPRDTALAASLDACRPEIEALGRSLVWDGLEPSLDKGRQAAFVIAKGHAEALLDN
ncbi:hypothetical protein [Phreatobacter stygius]|uniref:DUF1311 domain-containing protein n=1 Tax=Phreatobacter stygius TaxID=1940610 RepID=A0A4D7B2U8_9HYPH|nr:hypothetical protein [Phreatobacter stygius]QCI67854.1 hypothetical protein E8M01_28685 [Phreatobacter stygius]